MKDLESYENKAELLRVLAHPIRLAILDILRESEECVCHLEAYLGCRQAYISQQLMVLRNAGLITSSRKGLNIYYRLTDMGILDLIDAFPGKEHDSLMQLNFKASKSCTCPKCQASALADAFNNNECNKRN